jgi:hypothetical protein
MLRALPRSCGQSGRGDDVPVSLCAGFGLDAARLSHMQACAAGQWWTSGKVMMVWRQSCHLCCARIRSPIARQAICITPKACFQHDANLPRGGTVFVFRSRRADRLKLLYWEEEEDQQTVWGTVCPTNGLVMAYKRLEEATFTWPVDRQSFACKR